MKLGFTTSLDVYNTMLDLRDIWKLIIYFLRFVQPNLREIINDCTVGGISESRRVCKYFGSFPEMSLKHSTFFGLPCFRHSDFYSHCEAIPRRWREAMFICKDTSLLQRSNMSIEKTGTPLAPQMKFNKIFG